jgi:hypothetical protein
MTSRIIMVVVVVVVVFVVDGVVVVMAYVRLGIQQIHDIFNGSRNLSWLFLRKHVRIPVRLQLKEA